jgi:nicotinate-nucleotide adenylyltransferase
MGGSFDPIHNGHLAAAEAARRNFGLDSVLFIPAGKAPHKNDGAVTRAARRFEMTALAVAGNLYFEASSIEIERPGVSYTADTLDEIKWRHGKKTKLFFIAGADAVAEMFTWKSPERVFKACSVIAAARPGVAGETLDRQIAAARERYGARIFMLETPPLAISSTDIRRRIQIERPVRYFLPEIVEQYINQRRLYRDDRYDMEAAERRVSSKLSDKRWRHTMGVIDDSVRLAEIYGINRRKAYITAVFHDCAKELSSEEKLRRCDELGIQLDNITRSQPDLAHGPLSAEIARTEFNVDDPEILNAIRFHTTGCEQMSLLDKILLTADCTEPNRNHAGIEEIRKTALINLDKATALCLRMKIAYTESKRQMVHPLSLKALKEMEGMEEMGDKI